MISVGRIIIFYLYVLVYYPVGFADNTQFVCRVLKWTWHLLHVHDVWGPWWSLQSFVWNYYTQWVQKLYGDGTWEVDGSDRIWEVYIVVFHLRIALDFRMFYIFYKPKRDQKWLSRLIIYSAFFSWYYCLHAKHIILIVVEKWRIPWKQCLIGQAPLQWLFGREGDWIGFQRGYVLWRSLWRSMKLNLVSWVS